MKHNLKTLKECLDTANELPKILRWIEGFEAELQELEPDLPHLIACSSSTKRANRDYLQGFSAGFEQAKKKVLAE